MSKPDRILRERDVEAMTGLSRVTRWRREREGTFPKRLKIGPNSVGWLESQIRAWQESLPEAGGEK